MLVECINSVAQQTVLPKEHLIMVDYQYRGVQYVVNSLAEKIKTVWVQILSDDDLLLPEHLETVMNAREGYDLIYTYPIVQGRDMDLDIPFSEAKLRTRNFINCPLIKAKWLKKFKLNKEDGCLCDWKLYLNMLDEGCKFKSVPKHTWIFRFGHGNYSFGNSKSQYVRRIFYALSRNRLLNYILKPIIKGDFSFDALRAKMRRKKQKKRIFFT